jgi:transcription initiation factor TFIID subunit TAF12
MIKYSLLIIAMLLNTYKYLLTIKIILLVIGGSLLIRSQPRQKNTEEIPSLIFMLQLTDSMNIQDMQDKRQQLSRLQGAQQIILQQVKTLHPQQPIGFI